MYTLDLNPQTRPAEQTQWLRQLAQQLTELLFKKTELYPQDRFILAIDSNNKQLLSGLMLAAWELPISLFPIATELPQEYKRQLLKVTGTKILLTKEVKKYTDAAEIIDEKYFLELNKNNHISKCKTKNYYKNNPIKLIIATSGTSGNPKAVYLSQDNILAHIKAAQQRINLNHQHYWLNVLPLHHVGGAMIIYRTLLAKAKMLVVQRFEANEVWEVLRKRHISHLSLVPIMLEKLLQYSANPTAPKSLRVVLIGGSALSNELYQLAYQHVWPICVSYGSTETCSHIVTHCGYTENYAMGMVGKALPGVEIGIQASERNFDYGLLKIKGPMLMAGYANAEYKIGKGLQQGWFCSADVGYFDSNGCLVVLGRADDMINTGGEKINPQLLEEELLVCPGVRDVSIVPILDKSWGQRVALVYTGDYSEKQLLQWCEAHLQKHFKPRVIQKVSTLPRNQMGKLQKKEIFALLKSLGN